MRVGPGNGRIARHLFEVASLLEEQGADPFRVNAWRRAADVVAESPQPLADLLAAGGISALERLPAVGSSIARSIQELLATGRLPILERLRGERDPEAVLQTLPYVGPAIARLLHVERGIDTLEDLEAALHDGRLRDEPWFGGKRGHAIAEAVAIRLSRRPGVAIGRQERPTVSELLEVDQEYRSRVRHRSLPLIAPRRFNPGRTKWLPIMHLTRGGRDYTALFSNTARAHRFGRTRDWVVIYHDGRDGEHQATVVTARSGRLRGRRVVRGREAECLAHYHLWPEPSGTVVRFEAPSAAGPPGDSREPIAVREGG